MMQFRNRRLPVPSTHALMIVWSLVVAVTIGGLIWLTLFVLGVSDRTTEGRLDRAELRSELIAQKETSSILAKQLEALGETPVVEPAQPLPRTRYLVIRGKDGRPGLPGGPGIGGRNGVDGSNGADGAPGEPGPGPTDQQIADAVAAYCAAHNGCAPTPVPAP